MGPGVQMHGFEAAFAGSAAAVSRQGLPGGVRSFDLLVKIWKTGDELGSLFITGGDGFGFNWSGCDESQKCSARQRREETLGEMHVGLMLVKSRVLEKFTI